MMRADLSNCLIDPNYRGLDRDLRTKLKLAPHDAIFDKRESVRRLVLLTILSSQDFTLNHDALHSVCDMQTDGRIKVGYIGQVDPDNPKRLLAWDTAFNVRDLLNGIPPRSGAHGDYYFIQAETFHPAGIPRAARPAKNWNEDDDLGLDRPRRRPDDDEDLPWEEAPPRRHRR